MLPIQASCLPIVAFFALPDSPPIPPPTNLFPPVSCTSLGTMTVRVQGCLLDDRGYSVPKTHVRTHTATEAHLRAHTRTHAHNKHTHTHAHTRTHTHTYTYTYTLHTHTYTRSIDRLLVRSGRPLLLLQSDDRKERRIDGTRQREGREGGLRQLEFVRGSGANGSFRHVHPCQARGVILAGSFSVYVR